MSRISGPNQVGITPVVPGEVVNQTLLNQIISGANNARMVSGDGKIQVTQIGGIIGLSLAERFKADKSVMVDILPPTEGGTIGGGFYLGKIYTQSPLMFPSVAATNGGTTPLSPIPAPNVVTCYVLNLAEVQSAWYGDPNSTGPYTAVTPVITARRVAAGRVIGTMNSIGLAQPAPPVWLVAVDIPQLNVANISGLITGNASGNGKYVGKSFTDRTTDASASGNLAESDFGTLAGSNDCLILNAAELGSSTTGHDVTAAANTAQFAIYFVGRLLRINADGTKVVEVYMPYVGC